MLPSQCLRVNACIQKLSKQMGNAFGPRQAAACRAHLVDGVAGMRCIIMSIMFCIMSMRISIDCIR